jgi:hypothetical protein
LQLQKAAVLELSDVDHAPSCRAQADDIGLRNLHYALSPGLQIVPLSLSAIERNQRLAPSHGATNAVGGQGRCRQAGKLSIVALFATASLVRVT